MTRTLIRFSRGSDLTARRSWRALQRERINRPPVQHAERSERHVSPAIVPPGLRIVTRSPSDEELLRAIARCDRRALRMLVDRHNVRIFRFAMSITRDRSIAEEVVNDVFFDVARRAGSFAGRSSAATWLWAVARNKAISALHRREHQSDELAETIADTVDDPEIAIQKRQAGQHLAQCIGELPAIHRQIIDLVYYHQKSIREVADILQIPLGTVKTRMFHGRRRIAEMLAAKEGATDLAKPTSFMRGIAR